MRSKAVLDSSVIIRLARLDYLNFLFVIFDEIYVTYVTEEVKEEVLREGKPEVEAVKRFLRTVRT